MEIRFGVESESIWKLYICIGIMNISCFQTGLNKQPYTATYQQEPSLLLLYLCVKRYTYSLKRLDPSAPMQALQSDASFSGPTNPSSVNGVCLNDLNPENIPSHLRKEGSEWSAIFNSGLRRTLDVHLIQTFRHERYVDF